MAIKLFYYLKSFKRDSLRSKEFDLPTSDAISCLEKTISRLSQDYFCHSSVKHFLLPTDMKGLRRRDQKEWMKCILAMCACCMVNY